MKVNAESAVNSFNDHKSHVRLLKRSCNAFSPLIKPAAGSNMFG